MILGQGEVVPASRPVADVVEAAEAYLAHADERHSRSPEQRGFDLVQLRHAIDILELGFSEDAAAFAAEDEDELDGSATAIDWIRLNCKISGHAAAERLCTGEKLEILAASAEATIDGRVGYAHLALIARTASWFDDPPGTFRESELLTIAEDCSVSRFRHVCHAGNPDEYAADEERVAEQRTMTMTLCEDGGYSFGGKLDAAGGATLRTALEPLARKSCAGDDRHKERRLADALGRASAPRTRQRHRPPGRRPARPPAGHRQLRHCPRSHRRAGGRDGVLPSDLHQDHRAPRLRLQPHPGPAQLRFCDH